MRALLNRSAEQWAFLPRTDVPNSRLALFIHGFRGAYLDTWGDLSVLLSQHADNSPPFDQWDYLFVGYDTKDPKGYLDIARLIYTHWGKAAEGTHPFARRYDRLALFGHSLGTLGIRQALCAWSLQPDGMFKALQSVTLFGTPISGSPWAGVGSVFYPIADGLKEGNPQLAMLRTWLKSAYTRLPWPDVRIILGLDDRVVGHSSSDFVDWPGDRIPDLTTFDHGDIVKPKSWDNSSVLDYIRVGLT